MSVEPFKINVPQAKLDALRTKLDNATFPNDAPMTQDWSYGPPLADIKRLTARWREGFDWRAAEAKINNELPQFTTTVSVDGFGDLGIHLVHKRSSSPDAIPLLFCHGWPGSFIEVSKILPLLTAADARPSFHVVAPSMPNYAFSDSVGAPGFSIPQYAEAMHKTMLRLGYDRYVTQGGDWGFAVTRLMGNLYPKHCLASHWNYLYTPPPTLTANPLLYLRSFLPNTAEDGMRSERTSWFFNESYGYNKQQSTRPATIGYLQADSPVGVLAWIYEKLHDWTDSYPWTDDEILTWVSIYVLSRGGPDVASRIYYENVHSKQAAHLSRFEYNGLVKLGWSLFPRDLQLWPASHGHMLGPLVLQKRHADGGHFAAWERPDVLVGDLREMFGKNGGAEDVARRCRESKSKL
ncbi:epoxide hydrolase [Plectosphaerella cucumerina]|uniref:Epoxide hydrolase n=1 Tax=Plectosphaerella cucumerina TaxID=40658 RepID=A0A8K0TEY7_9PEZI|nr:epoxide hydrolase [Plectosphaerella cucumerina]